MHGFMPLQTSSYKKNEVDFKSVTQKMTKSTSKTSPTLSKSANGLFSLIGASGSICDTMLLSDNVAVFFNSCKVFSLERQEH